MRYNVGMDIIFHKQTQGRKEIALYDEDWVTATEYAIELVQSQHPNADIELAYVEERDARYMLPMSTKVLYTSEISC